MTNRRPTQAFLLLRIGATVSMAITAVGVVRDGLRSPTAQRLYVNIAQALHRTIGWHRLPLALCIAVLLSARSKLRQANLYDISTASALQEQAQPRLQSVSPRYLTARSPDSSYSDLNRREMGSGGTRFTLEHNAICDRLAAARQVGRLSTSEVLSDTPGSLTDHHGVPHAISEELVAVYRMYPLLPDGLRFRSLTNDEVLLEARFRTWLSITRFVQRPIDLDGLLNDVAAMDFLRTRAACASI